MSDTAARTWHCLAVGCVADVPEGRDWCGPHWRLIPKRLQTRLYHARGPERRRLFDEARQAVEQAEFGGRLL